MNLIILPNQLFPLKLIENMKDIHTIYLIEEPRYFTDFKFHKLKIMYHRASMKKYESSIKNKSVKYIEFKDVDSDFYKKLNNDKTYYFNPIDHDLFNKFKKKLNTKFVIVDIL